jgi:hypothetical protein
MPGSGAYSLYSGIQRKEFVLVGDVIYNTDDIPDLSHAVVKAFDHAVQFKGCIADAVGGLDAPLRGFLPRMSHFHRLYEFLRCRGGVPGDIVNSQAHLLCGDGEGPSF